MANHKAFTQEVPNCIIEAPPLASNGKSLIVHRSIQTLGKYKREISSQAIQLFMTAARDPVCSGKMHLRGSIWICEKASGVKHLRESLWKEASEKGILGGGHQRENPGAEVSERG